MAVKYRVLTEAERLIHNDLSATASFFQRRVKEQGDKGEMGGIYQNMMASLVFCAFSIEAKVNFVGWSVLNDSWDERAKLKEKIKRLDKALELGFSWGNEPLQTIKKLKDLRDVLAHGKPEHEYDETILENEPQIFDALKSQWEETVNPVFVAQCADAENMLWKRMLEKADIPEKKTLTSAAQSLSEVVVDQG